MKQRMAMMAACAFLLTACGSKEEENVTAPTPVPVKRPVTPADPTADMAIAPADDKKGDGELIVKYTLATAPQIGKPIEAELAFVSTVDLAASALIYTAQPDITLGSDASGSLPSLKAAQVELRKLRLTPQKAGITYFSVSVTTGVAPDTTTRVFSVPLIVGDGTVVAPPTKPAAPAPVKKPA